MFVLDPNAVSLPAAAAAVGGALLAVALLKPATGNKMKSSRPIHTLEGNSRILGDLLEVAKYADTQPDWMAAQCARFNYEAWQFAIPCTPVMVVLSNQKDVEAVLTTQFDQFVKGPMHNDLVQDLLGSGLISSDGEQWYHQRKTAAKFFTARTLRSMMMHTMHKNMTKVHASLEAKCGKQDDSVDLTLLFHQYTMQTFMEVGVGLDFPVIGNDKPLPFEVAMDATTPIITRRSTIPTFAWKLERWLNIGMEKELARLIKITRENAHELITKALEKIHHEPEPETQTAEKVRSAIDLFVEHSDPEKLGLRPEDLVDFIMTFVMAARDTTSVTLSWLFYMVHKHPEVESNIRREFAAKLPSLGVDQATGYITADHTKHLVYLEATIKETLRLYPAAPLNMRQAVDDTYINDDLFIKKGQVIVIPIYAMARNVNVWGPDAAEFKPERWIDATTGELLQLQTDRYFSFSTGPRTCIGMKLAMLNLRVISANLLHRYKFKLDPANDGSYISALTLLMKHELRASVERA